MLIDAREHLQLQPCCRQSTGQAGHQASYGVHTDIFLTTTPLCNHLSKHLPKPAYPHPHSWFTANSPHGWCPTLTTMLLAVPPSLRSCPARLNHSRHQSRRKPGHQQATPTQLTL